MRHWHDDGGLTWEQAANMVEYIAELWQELCEEKPIEPYMEPTRLMLDLKLGRLHQRLQVMKERMVPPAGEGERDEHA